MSPVTREKPRYQLSRYHPATSSQPGGLASHAPGARAHVRNESLPKVPMCDAAPGLGDARTAGARPSRLGCPDQPARSCPATGQLALRFLAVRRSLRRSLAAFSHCSFVRSFPAFLGVELFLYTFLCTEVRNSAFFLVSTRATAW